MPRRRQTSKTYPLRRRLGLALSLSLFLLILLAPAPSGLAPAAQTILAATALMAVLWITEAIPIAATALLPLVIFPIFHAEKFATVARYYAHSNIFLFFGGFVLAAAIQKWGLHRRIALNLAYRIGANPRRIVLGFMIATAFLSMWISNTATTLMVYPIALAVLTQLSAPGDHGQEHLRTALMLGVAYAASVGGIATLIGTPPNIVFASAITELYPQAPPVTFMQWMAIGLPLALCFIPIIWLLLTRLVFKVGTEGAELGKQYLLEQIHQLGRWHRAEKTVSVVFALTALAWITLDDLDFGGFVLRGWASRLHLEATVNDATVAMGAAVLLFFLPVNFRRGEFVLAWEDVERIPWGILILFGGGIALAGAFETSGLAAWIGTKLALLRGIPIPVIVALIAVAVSFLTEMTSNTATATLLMPILAGLAHALNTHPYLLMIPATISASCAFMMPVATPPNAIVFASGYVTMPQMARAGVLLNLIGAVLVTLLIFLVAAPLLSLHTAVAPAWAQ